MTLKLVSTSILLRFDYRHPNLNQISTPIPAVCHAFFSQADSQVSLLR